MLNYDPAAMYPWLVGFFVLAAVAGLLSVGALGSFVLTNRRVRVARHESIPAYYRALAFSH